MSERGESNFDAKIEALDNQFGDAVRSAFFAIKNRSRLGESDQHKMMLPLFDYLRSAQSLSRNECAQLADIFEQQIHKQLRGHPDDSGKKERFKYLCIANMYRFVNKQNCTKIEAARMVEQQLEKAARFGQRATTQQILNWEGNLTPQVRAHLQGLSEVDAHRFYSEN